ncbi:MAG: hypothetical protein IH847_03175 [Acidobacteria bacterium]|nr:hypothetical protein [Acidobacteriota bacterium]
MDFRLQLCLPLAHLFQFPAQVVERLEQFLLEAVQGVFHHFGLEHLSLELGKQPVLNHVLSDAERIVAD